LVLAVLGALTTASAKADVVYTYDAAGRVRTARYDNGLCVAYAYDANGNRTAQSGVSGGTPATAVWGSGVWGCFNWTP
jgi:YD repeat-containing protein